MSRMDVLTPTEKDGKTYWTKIGAAWPAKDGAYSVNLNALPINGKMLIVVPKERNQDAPISEHDQAKGNAFQPLSSDDIPF